MKYIAVIDTDDYKDFKFFEDGNGKYMRGIDAGAENNEWIALYFTECEQESILDKIKAEIAEYKDDKVIHYERNEMIDIVLGIIDKYREGENE